MGAPVHAGSDEDGVWIPLTPKMRAFLNAAVEGWDERRGRMLMAIEGAPTGHLYGHEARPEMAGPELDERAIAQMALDSGLNGLVAQLAQDPGLPPHALGVGHHHHPYRGPGGQGGIIG